VLSTSTDKTLKLWNAETGAKIRTFTGHHSEVSGCAFSPDGTRLVSASGDDTLKLWNTETSDEIRTFTGHSGPAYSCAFSPDGTRLVSSSVYTLKLWDTETGAEIKTFIGHSNDVGECTFSPDGTRVLSASCDKTLKLWDAETGAETITFTKFSDTVDGCAFSPNGTKLLSASRDTLKLWDAETGVEIRTFIGHSDQVSGCAFSPDDTKVLSTSMDNTLKLWDAETGAEIRTFTGHSGGVWGCAFSPDGTRLVSASMDNTLKLWDAETGVEIRTFTGHSDWVMGCVFSPDGTKVLSASWDKTLKLWDADTGNVLIVFPALGRFNSIAIGVNGLIAAGESSGWVYILQLHNIPLRSAIVTPVKLYNFKTKSYDKKFSINCKWCGVRFPLDDDMLWSKSEDHPKGCLGELIECPTCHKSLKLNKLDNGIKETEDNIIKSKLIDEISESFTNMDEDEKELYIDVLLEGSPTFDEFMRNIDTKSEFKLTKQSFNNLKSNFVKIMEEYWSENNLKPPIYPLFPLNEKILDNIFQKTDGNPRLIIEEIKDFVNKSEESSELKKVKLEEPKKIELKQEKNQATISVITTDKILDSLSNEWQTVKQIIIKLKIKNLMDARSLQFKLEELERLGKVLVDIKKGKKHWKLKLLL